MGLAGTFAWRTRAMEGVRPEARRLLALLTAQVALGCLVLAQRLQPILRTSHVALGALVLAQAVVLVWEVFRTSPAPAACAP